MAVIRGVMIAMASSTKLLSGGFGSLIGELCCVSEGRLCPFGWIFSLPPILFVIFFTLSDEISSLYLQSSSLFEDLGLDH